jgi:hypothetical protein
MRTSMLRRREISVLDDVFDWQHDKQQPRNGKDTRTMRIGFLLLAVLIHGFVCWEGGAAAPPYQVHGLHARFEN